MTFHVNPAGLMGLEDWQCEIVFRAGSNRFNPSIHCAVVDAGDGWFALYGPGTSFPMVVTQDWNEIGKAYAARPPYRAHARAPSVVPPKAVAVKGVNLSGLNINI